MRKLIYSMAVCVLFTLTACGSGSTTSEGNDSTSVASDSTSVQSVNSGVESGDTTAVKQ